MRLNSYTIEWTSQALKQFKNIRNAELSSQILNIIEHELAVNPLIGKPLCEPFQSARSYRVGKLRIIYKFYKDRLVIVILRVDHRKAVYKIH